MGLEESGETKQVSILLSCLGEEAEGNLALMNAKDKESKEYKEVSNQFVLPSQESVMYEHARFNKLSEQSGETAEQYIMVPCDLTKTCNYRDMM